MARPNEAPLPEPLAYFLTWTTYGTWLPGDDRGWVKRGNGFQLADEDVFSPAEARMSADACRFNHRQRTLVEKTISDHCRIRNWTLFVANCRSNHVHVVVAANLHPDQVREQFKAWCTRKLKEQERLQMQGGPVRTDWWGERGSSRYLNDDESLEAAILYVRDGQDRPDQFNA